jgi:hypothetical protein
MAYQSSTAGSSKSISRPPRRGSTNAEHCQRTHWRTSAARHPKRRDDELELPTIRVAAVSASGRSSNAARRYTPSATSTKSVSRVPIVRDRPDAARHRHVACFECAELIVLPPSAAIRQVCHVALHGSRQTVADLCSECLLMTSCLICLRRQLPRLRRSRDRVHFTFLRTASLWLQA